MKQLPGREGGMRGKAKVEGIFEPVGGTHERAFQRFCCTEIGLLWNIRF